VDGVRLKVGVGVALGRPRIQAGGSAGQRSPVTAPHELAGPFSTRRASCRRAKINRPETLWHSTAPPQGSPVRPGTKASGSRASRLTAEPGTGHLFDLPLLAEMSALVNSQDWPG
jgi:hypothetical protein